MTRPVKSASRRRSRSQPAKLSGAGKMLLSALSLGAFVGGWNLLARYEGQTANQELPPPPGSAGQTEGVLSSGFVAERGAIANLTPPPALTPLSAGPLTPSPSPPPLPTPTPPPTATIAAPVEISAERLDLMAPISEATEGLTFFQWVWRGPIPPGYGFEVLVWAPGQPFYGAHDAVADNLTGRIEHLGGDQYGLLLDVRGAAGVQNRPGDYLWSVALVQVEPTYANTGIYADPVFLHLGGPGQRGGGQGGHRTKGS